MTYEVYSEQTGKVICALVVNSEAAALFGVSWGYAGAEYLRDEAGELYVKCGIETYRARAK